MKKPPTTKAAELAKNLQGVDMAKAMQILEQSNKEALHFDVINDSMCLMHDDGSVNIMENVGRGILTTEVISAANILRVLQHYRPFKDVFKGHIQ